MPADDTYAAHPERDESWDAQARHETPTERLDRNWSDLIQELRVVQTGVQFLTGFLLTLPFQQRFTQLDDPQQALYLATVSMSVAATAFLQTPVSVHRALFRRHRREMAVLIAHRLSVVGLALLAGAIVGVAGLIFDVVIGTGAGVAAAVATAVGLVVLWAYLPLSLRTRTEPEPEPAQPR
jgi:O-antigen/teichoic acid export membrane protein